MTMMISAAKTMVAFPRQRRGGVAPEGHRHHRRYDRVGQVGQPRGDPGEVAVTGPLRHVLQQPAGRRIPGTQLGERVTLQHRDEAGDEERQPHRRASHFPGRAEQREDPRAHHRPDPDERSLAHRQVLIVRLTGR
jgi:hypothetical protein